jgi:DNA-binding transcriptional LysR family regulator
MDVNDVLIFVRVIQAGSFSRAAKLLKMPVSTVSRRVAELEEELGVPLIQRTTRSLKITDVGSAYFEHGKTIAAEIEKAEALVTNLQSIPQGLLKITAAADFGTRFLGEIVTDFLKTNPRVQADVLLTERVVDLVGEGFDLAIRMGELDDSSLMARKLGSLNMFVYASPDFLKISGEPKSCLDLAKQECIRFTGEDDQRWSLKSSKGAQMTVKVSGRITSNNMESVRTFALAGAGFALMPKYLCDEDVKAGRLKIVLKDWAQNTGPIHLVFPGQKFQLPKVRAFADHLIRYFAQHPFLGKTARN